MQYVRRFRRAPVTLSGGGDVSVFTKARTAWSTPGVAPGLGDLGATVQLASWAPYLAIGGLALLALMRKIPWWAAGLGGAGAWFLLGGVQGVTNPVMTNLTLNGQGLLPSGQTVPVSGLQTNGYGAVMVNGAWYTVIDDLTDSMGNVTYYLQSAAGPGG